MKAAASASGSTPYNFRVEIPNAGAAGATLRYSFKAIASKFRDKPGGLVVDYLGIAKAINRTELYKQAAGIVGVPVPKSDFRSSKLIDGVVWDGKDPKKYAASFKIHA